MGALEVWDHDAKQYTGVDENHPLPVVNLDHAHYEIHTGQHWSVQDMGTIASAANLDLIFTTPASNYMHAVFYAMSTGVAQAQLYEGVTTGTAATGTAVTIYNRNRLSGLTSGMTVKRDQTAATVGNRLTYTPMGSGLGANAIGGVARAENEWILGTSGTYLLRVTSGTNGNVIAAGCDFYLEEP